MVTTVKVHGEVRVVWTGQLPRRADFRTSEATPSRAVMQAIIAVFRLVLTAIALVGVLCIQKPQSRSVAGAESLQEGTLPSTSSQCRRWRVKKRLTGSPSRIRHLLSFQWYTQYRQAYWTSSGRLDHFGARKQRSAEQALVFL